MTCPQCKQPIGTVSALGWCNKEIHFGPCLTLHIRNCVPCRGQNEAVIQKTGGRS